MKNTDHLFGLIRALTKAEKRHFKMTASRYTKHQNNYLLLFDAIDQQSVYDEQKLKKKFKAKTLGKNIGKTKYLLYQLILKSIRPLNSSKSIPSQLEGLLDSIDFLYTKCLYKQADSLIQKAKAQAKHYQLYPFYLKVLSYEKKLLGHLPSEQVGKKIDVFLQEHKEVSNEIQMELRYQLSIEKLHLLSFTNEKEEWESTLIEELNYLPIESFFSTPSFRCKILRTELLALKAILLEKNKKALALYRSLFHMWQEHQYLIPVFQSDFDRSIGYYVQYLLLQDDSASTLKQVLQLLQKTQEESVGTQRIKKQLEYCILDFIVQLTSGHTELSAVKMIFLKDHLPQIQSLTPAMTQAKLYYHAAIFYLTKRDFSETLDWIHLANKTSKHLLFPRDQRFIKMMELIARYELGEYEYLASAIRNQYRSLQREDHHNKLEKLILKSVKRLINTSQKAEANAIFFQLYNSLLAMKKEKTINQDIQTNVLYEWVTNNLSFIEESN